MSYELLTVVACNGPGCQVCVVPPLGKRVQAAEEVAEAAGWTRSANARHHLCPGCQDKGRRAIVRLVEP